MANPTTAFGWVMPNSADLVTDLPADFNVFGQGVDTSMQFLLGGTTGQVLSKTSATNMAFTWINNDVGDITGVTAGTGITGGGTSGTVTVTNDMATTITTNGDLLYGTGSGTYTRRAIGSTAQVLTVVGGVPTWAAAAASGKLIQIVQATYSTQMSSSSTSYVTSNLTATITPTLATSKILIFCTSTGVGAASEQQVLTIFRGTVSGTNLAADGFATNGAGISTTTTITFLDSPNTTSAQVYTLARKSVASGTSYLHVTGKESVMLLVEIRA